MGDRLPPLKHHALLSSSPDAERRGQPAVGQEETVEGQTPGGGSGEEQLQGESEPSDVQVGGAKTVLGTLLNMKASNNIYRYEKII